jgi:cellulose synthase/poly-beta-1,6-N-acetylglucosamine synthase-like glycosyltransferase
VVCVSGAFGAFRRTALDSVGGLDCGSGEDLDCTIRLRKAGWKVAFAGDAMAYTKVPSTLSALVRQRFRWERDALRLRYRKHGELMNPFSRRFILLEFLHEAEFILFNVIAAAAMPLYLIWLVLSYGHLALMILVAAQTGLLMLDVAAFALASLTTAGAGSLKLLPYLPGYSLFNGLFMRFVRLAAYLQEWLFDASSKDSYVPRKVNLVRKW